MCNYLILIRLSLKKGMGNGEQGMGTGNGERGVRLTIYHKLWHSEQFEGAEFIDDNSFL